MTVGAAASLVLTVSPGLVVPNSAAAATVRPAANLRLQPIPDDDDEVAIVGYRNRMRAAGRARAAARAQANQAFRDAVAPARQALVAALAAATSGPQRRAAKIAYGVPSCLQRLRARPRFNLPASTTSRPQNRPGSTFDDSRCPS